MHQRIKHIIIIFILVLSYQTRQSASAQVREKLLPLTNRLGCLFVQEPDYTLNTYLAILGEDDSSYTSLVSFRRALVRRRARKRRLVRAGRRQNRINRISGTITDLKKCKRMNTTIGAEPGAGLNSCVIIGDQPEISLRIINGTKCVAGNTPVLFLNIYNENSANPLQGSCTGTLISPRTILTAAHCLPRNITRVDVVTDEGEFSSTRFFAHELYNGFSSDYDVGVVILEEELTNRTVAVLSENDLTPSEELLIAGYGLVDHTGTGRNELGPGDGITDGLQSGFMRVHRVSHGSIKARYNFRKGGSNTCNGDSGGPAFVKRGDDWVLAGVISNGRNLRCGRRDISGFANLTADNVKSFLAEYVE